MCAGTLVENRSCFTIKLFCVLDVRKSLKVNNGKTLNSLNEIKRGKYHSRRRRRLSPGMMNHGDLVGNRKGCVLVVTQNGPTLPRGTPLVVGGTVAPATASVPSGRAFPGSFGAAQTNRRR